MGKAICEKKINNNSAESSVKHEFSPLESLGHQNECKSLWLGKGNAE